MTTALSLLFLWFGSALVMAQSSKPNNCVLESAATGQMITVHGKVVHGPHDMLLDLPNCDSVVIEYAEVAAPGQDNSRHITRHSNFRRFESYVRAEYPNTNDGGVCLGCFKYQVEATFKGRLDVARLPQALSKDSQGF